jgi:hypothetical protein
MPLIRALLLSFLISSCGSETFVAPSQAPKSQNSLKSNNLPVELKIIYEVEKMTEKEIEPSKTLNQKITLFKVGEEWTVDHWYFKIGNRFHRKQYVCRSTSDKIQCQ